MSIVPVHLRVLLLVALIFPLSVVKAGDDWSPVAREYVLLTLSMQPHDGSFVDAYYGPAELKAQAERQPLTLVQIEKRAGKLQRRIARLAVANDDQSELSLRREYLNKQTSAMRSRIEMLQGKKFRFDEETRLLYDAVAPTYPRAHFLAVQKELDALLPGEGSLVERIDAFRAQFVIPKDKLKAVFDAAIAGCREQTVKHLKLPEGEGFRLEFVTDKPWSGYNWYQGGYQSLIQINIDAPIQIERAIDLGCHEGYPGHHTYNALIERELVKSRGWVEFSVYPLWSPQSLIAEGTANFGIEMAFPKAQRLTFQRDVLYPVAGLDVSQIERYERFLELMGSLAYAGNEAARGYLDGTMTRQQAVDWMRDVALYPADLIERRIRFFDVNRGYVINYNLGKDMVADWIDARTTGQTDAEAARWRAFIELLSSPRLPSGLQ